MWIMGVYLLIAPALSSRDMQGLEVAALFIEEAALCLLYVPHTLGHIHSYPMVIALAVPPSPEEGTHLES